jgi:hypothetical protein
MYAKDAVIIAGELRKLIIHPSEKYTTNDVLFFRDARQAAFDRDGDYVIRARIVNLTDITGISATIPVLVTAIPDSEKVAIENNANTLYLSVGPEGMQETLTIKEMSTLREKLSRCELRETLDWMIAVKEVREAHSTDDLRDAKLRLNRINMEQNSCVRQTISLVLARELVNGERYDEAKQSLLSIINGYNYHRDRIQKTIDYALREKGRKNATKQPPAS